MRKLIVAFRNFANAPNKSAKALNFACLDDLFPDPPSSFFSQSNGCLSYVLWISKVQIAAWTLARPTLNSGNLRKIRYSKLK
jgi:hypothetical protein